MISAIYQKTFQVLKQKPLRLWGLSLLSGFLALVAELAFIAIPIVGTVIALVLSTGMAMVYLAGYRGEGFETENLFEGFKNGKFGRIAGGMAWMYLWIVLWSLIPIVGIVFGIIKVYQYRFTPYILMTRPEVKTLDAIKVSKAETTGYKGKMFGAEILFTVIITAAIIVLSLLGLIPFVGGLFYFILFIVVIIVSAFAPLFLGIMEAAFYDEIQQCIANPAHKVQYEKTSFSQASPAQSNSDQQDASFNFCPGCGVKIDAESAFCPNCGKKLN